MTATSHAITGAAIGLIISQPILALPAAFASHFVLDSLPHFAFNDLDKFEQRKKIQTTFRLFLLFDTALLALFSGFLFYAGAGLLIFSALILAYSPDLVWAYRYIFRENFGVRPFPQMSAFSRFHVRIQKLDTPKGGFFELPFTLIVLVFVIMKL